jgi:hypothetical protein
MNKLDSYFLCIYLLQKQGTFSYAVLLIVTYLCKTDTIFTLEKKENKDEKTSHLPTAGSWLN